MDASKQYSYYLIRDATVLVKMCEEATPCQPEFYFDLFDVRTGTRLKDIYPPFEPSELKRAFKLSGETASVILKNEALSTDGEVNQAPKVVTIVEARQRKLDSVVADSIIDQVQVIDKLLQDFLCVARKAPREERFWLSQQVLSLVRKFSGRELAELQEILEWFKSMPRRT
ncbi:MAG: hypothetical protein ACLPVO_04790 [Desulfomonilaceae bacterium]|nr:hypothetical protein [Syntrophaceae bacterium]